MRTQQHEFGYKWAPGIFIIKTYLIVNTVKWQQVAMATITNRYVTSKGYSILHNGIM